MSNFEIDILVNLIIFVLFLFSSILIISKMKFEHKGYKYMFITYIIFWIPIMLVREYRGKAQNLIDPNMLWIVLASYGFIGIFARPISDFFSLRVNSRKIILIISVLLMFGTTLPFIFYANTYTNVIQAIGIGIGASMIGIYELMFKEQYTTNKSYLTVSILAIPPLLADFITSPIQSLVTIGSNNSLTLNLFNDLNGIIILWIIAACFFVIALIMILYLKEDRTRVALFLNSKNSEISNSDNKNNFDKSLKVKKIIFFTLVFLLGSIIAFVKFSNSGSIAITTMELLGKEFNINVSNFQAYISLVFSIFQLLGSISIYWFVTKKKSPLIAFTIGVISWLVYHLLISLIHHPIAYFALTPLNGIGYGILYNMVLAMALSLTFSTKKITPMGSYQAILAIGITSSSFFTTFLRGQIYNFNSIFIVNIILMVISVLIFIIYFFINNLSKKKELKLSIFFNQN